METEHEHGEEGVWEYVNEHDTLVHYIVCTFLWRTLCNAIVGVHSCAHIPSLRPRLCVCVSAF